LQFGRRPRGPSHVSEPVPSGRSGGVSPVSGREDRGLTPPDRPEPALWNRLSFIPMDAGTLHDVRAGRELLPGWGSDPPNRASPARVPPRRGPTGRGCGRARGPGP
jgi:hypothetical protein